MKKVIEDTAHIVELYGIPELEDGMARQLITEHMDKDKIMIVKKDQAEILDLVTGLGSSRFIDEAIDDDTDYVYIPGAFTNSVIADINPHKLRQVNFVIKDPTKIFINQMDWGKLRKRKFKVNVMKNIEVAAVTVNPIAPSGYSFDHRVLRDAMQEALPEIPVIDVRI